MDAPAADSTLGSPLGGWLEAERASGRFYRFAGIATALLLVAIASFSAWLLSRGAEPGSLLSPPLIALLLVANLIPAIALMVLLSRRVAHSRAVRGGLPSGRLHTRLVALFSVIAAVPTVIVAIFASLLLQSGLEFWFSDRARTMLENTVQVAENSYKLEVSRVGDEAAAMTTDLTTYLRQVPIDSPQFGEGVAVQTYRRGLNEATVLTLGKDGEVRSFALVNAYEGMIVPDDIRRAAATLNKAGDIASVPATRRIAVLSKVPYGDNTYLYISRWNDPQLSQQIQRANDVLQDYRALLSRSRLNQFRFNAALLFGALIIVGLAILAALRLADRLVRPVGQLVAAAGRIEEGDFSARVPVAETEDEIQTLASAFNRMTGRLQEQTGALKAANAQLETRGAFTEAVLSSVTAGIIALDTDNRIRLINPSAASLLQKGEEQLDGERLAKISPDLGEFLTGDAREADVLANTDSGQRMLAVKRVRYADGAVLTFDDITDQLADQRRAAWSDIARRIAHEIRNPLTPIQLAAERLQRRFGAEVKSDSETFERLTGTIVRQVGDLRRMVDEFSNFARMPKPVFRTENVLDIARQAVFLHEVAHPGIKFSVDAEEGDYAMVSDRRQLGQALSNVVKNAVEAIESRKARGEHSLAGDRVDLRVRRSGSDLVVDVMDTGVGLPEERERLTEPYMTTRVRGTGLGLAIVKKIVEEHFGEIAFLDRPGGGTHVRIVFDIERLAALVGDAAADEQAAPEEDTE